MFLVIFLAVIFVIKSPANPQLYRFPQLMIAYCLVLSVFIFHMFDIVTHLYFCRLCILFVNNWWLMMRLNCLLIGREDLITCSNIGTGTVTNMIEFVDVMIRLIALA